MGQQSYCRRLQLEEPQRQDNERTAQRDMQMECSERKWVLNCIPQSRWWVFLNKFLNTVSDFTTCPKFVLHPALHSFTQSTRMLFSQTVWLPLSSLALSLHFLLLPHDSFPSLFVLAFFFFHFLLFIQPLVSVLPLNPPPCQSYFWYPLL